MSATPLIEVSDGGPTATPKQWQSSLPPAKANFTSSRWIAAMTTIIIDLGLVCLSGLFAYRIRFSPDLLSLLGSLEHPVRNSTAAASSYAGFLLLYAVVIALIARARQHEWAARPVSGTAECLLVMQAVGIATILLTAAIYISGNKTISRLVVGLCAAFSALVLCTWRLCRASWIRRQRSKGIGLRHALIVGAGEVGELLAKQLQTNPTLGYSVRGFLDSNHHHDGRILGKIGDLVEVTRREFIDDVFITIPSERQIVKDVTIEGRKLGLTINVVPDFYDGLAWHSPVETIGPIPVRVLHRVCVPTFGLLLKRLTDIAGSTAGLILLSPVLAVVAAAIKIDSPGPVFYSASRVGRKGRKFTCVKFRTMVENADELKYALRPLNERQGPFFKITDDPRITNLGRFLRKYSLDELPQLWNVLKGEMSLVGPRPHPQDDYERYATEHFRRLDVTPGITCLWQVCARNDPSFERVLALDTEYIEHWRYLLDLKILMKTIPAVLRGDGN